MSRRVHLVGSIGLDTLDEVFTSVGRLLGPHLRRMPHREVGGRRMWITWQAPLLRANPFLQVDSSSPQLSDFAPLRIADGAGPEEIHFGELGYAREARASYLDFPGAKSRGDSGSAVRFQDSLPTLWAIVGVGRVSRADFPHVFRAYERAMLEELARLCCALRRLIAAVPADLETGIRLCYGERDGHSFIEPLDLGKAMKFPTLDVERIDRPLNWVHVPVPIGREDDAHYARSRVLRLPEGAEPYVRVVHAADGLQVRPTSRLPARVAIGRGKASPTDCVQERGCRALCSEVRHRRGMRFARARRPDGVKQFLETHAGAAAL